MISLIAVGEMPSPSCMSGSELITEQSRWMGEVQESKAFQVIKAGSVHTLPGLNVLIASMRGCWSLVLAM